MSRQPFSQCRLLHHLAPWGAFLTLLLLVALCGPQADAQPIVNAQAGGLERISGGPGLPLDDRLPPRSRPLC